MDEREPVWKESGRNFIGSVTTLLERLLDYRNALQVGTFCRVVHLLCRHFCSIEYLSLIYYKWPPTLAFEADLIPE